MADGLITGKSFLVIVYCGWPSTSVKLTLTVLSGEHISNDRVLHEEIKAETINRQVMGEEENFIY